MTAPKHIERRSPAAPGTDRAKWTRSVSPARVETDRIAALNRERNASIRRRGVGYDYAPKLEPCHVCGAKKCGARSNPADLGLVELWVPARETGEGDDDWRIPNEILALLCIASPPQ
jgi:hypothetical protein